MAVNYTIVDEKVCLPTIDSYTPVEQGFILGAFFVNIVILIMNLIQNTFIIWTVYRNSDLHRPSFVLLGCLSLTDLLTGIIAQPLFVVPMITTYYYQLKPNCLVITFGRYTGVLLSGISFGTLALMSIDRYLALHYHLRYTELVTIPRVLISYSIIWSMVLAIIIIPFSLGMNKVIIIMSGATEIICTVVIICCYWRIYRIAQRHQRQIQSLDSAMHQEATSERIHKIRKSSTTFFIITAVLLCCLLPYVAFMICLISFGPKELVVPFGTISITMALSRSSIDPIIYFWRLTEIRQSLKQQLRLLFSRSARVQ